MLSRCLRAVGLAGAMSCLLPMIASAQEPSMMVVGTNLELGAPTLMEDGDTFTVEAIVGETLGFGFTVRNLGDANLEFGDPAVTLEGFGAGAFVAQNTSPVIGPNGLTIVGVSFTPPAVGPHAALLTIHSNEPETPEFTIILQGQGVPEPFAAMQVRDRADGTAIPHNGLYNLGDLLVGDIVDLTLEVMSIGTGELLLLGAQIEGDGIDEITIAGGNVSVRPGETQDLELTYRFVGAGRQEAKLQMVNNSAQQPYVITLVADVAEDCNENGADDLEDIAEGASEDCDLNDVPDECQQDADSDGVIDACERCPGEDDTRDADDDGTPDCLQELAADCNGNGREDAEDIMEGRSEDCDLDEVPDECQQDDDADGVINGCDRCPGLDDLQDQSGNGVPDCLEVHEDEMICGIGAGTMMPLMLSLMFASRRRRR